MTRETENNDYFIARLINRLQKGSIVERMKTSTATHGEIGEPISLERLQKAMREINLLPQLDQWVVIDPQGRMYKGTIQEVLPIVVAAHPPFKFAGT